MILGHLCSEQTSWRKLITYYNKLLNYSPTVEVSSMLLPIRETLSVIYTSFRMSRVHGTQENHMHCWSLGSDSRLLWACGLTCHAQIQTWMPWHLPACRAVRSTAGCWCLLSTAAHLPVWWGRLKSNMQRLQEHKCLSEQTGSDSCINILWIHIVNPLLYCFFSQLPPKRPIYSRAFPLQIHLYCALKTVLSLLSAILTIFTYVTDKTKTVKSWHISPYVQTTFFAHCHNAHTSLLNSPELFE